jgi:hypothetical protein
MMDGMRARRAVLAAALVAPATALAACFLFPSFDGVTRDYGLDASSAEGAARDAMIADADGGGALDGEASDGNGLDAIGAGCDADLAVDEHACGACGHDCAGGSCEGGRCQPYGFAAGGGTGADLAVDDAYVYWTASGAIWQRVLDGGGAAGTLVSNLASPTYVAVDDGHVVWTENACSQGGIAPCLVRARDKQTGTVLVLDADAGLSPSGVAVDGTSAFWPVGQASIVKSAPEDGGGAATQINELGTVLANVQNVVVAGSSVYVDVSNYGAAGAIVQIARGGGTPEPVVGEEPVLFTPLATNGSAIAWVGVDDAGVQSIAMQNVVSGLSTTLVPVTPGTTAVALAMDADHVYWITAGPPDAGSSAGTVQVAPLDGGPAATLGTGVPVWTSGYTHLGRLVSARDSVLWLAPLQIMRVAK